VPINNRHLSFSLLFL